MTSWSGAASLMSYASLRAFSSWGRVLMQVEIFSEKIRLQTGSSAASCEASSCWAVDQRAYPIRIGWFTHAVCQNCHAQHVGLERSSANGDLRMR